LPLRYRKPYTARHTSVSWNLMLGKSPLWVALQHGHRIATMLSVYAGWVEGARECAIVAIRRAMGYEQEKATPTTPISIPVPVSTLLTGWGRESETWVIRVRLDSSASAALISAGEMSARAEPTTGHKGKTPGLTGQTFASTEATNAAKSLKRLRKTGGADGTRTCSRRSRNH
jgi:hypothetical protein